MWNDLQNELDTLAGDGLGRTLLPLERPGGSHVVVGGQRLLNFASNDYLGLGAASSTRHALQEGIAKWGGGSGASRLVTGNTVAHEAAEHALADFVDMPASLLFSSGYVANVALLSALGRDGDHLFCDALNHASLIDGARLSRASTHIYRHSDVDHLASLLGDVRARDAKGRCFVVTESVFSMDGDRARLAELRQVADEYGCTLIVDDAHALGLLGPHGCGLGKGVADVVIGTLGKSFGLWGAFVAGPVTLRRWLFHYGRGFVFSTGVAPALAHAVSEMVQVVLGADAARARVLQHSKRIGAAVCPDRGALGSAIVPLIVGDAKAAVKLSEALLERGLLVRAIRPPTVPDGTSRLRFVPNASHTPMDVDALLAALVSFAAGGDIEA